MDVADGDLSLPVSSASFFCSGAAADAGTSMICGFGILSAGTYSGPFLPQAIRVLNTSNKPSRCKPVMLFPDICLCPAITPITPHINMSRDYTRSRPNSHEHSEQFRLRLQFLFLLIPTEHALRLRTNIFLRVFLATLAPLILIAMGASYYSEARFAEDVQHEVLTNLHNISASLQQDLRNHRNLTLGIARAPAVQTLLPSLQRIQHGLPTPQLAAQREQINRYFEGFQTILPAAFYLRLLDAQGNTLVKVSHNKRSSAVYDSLNGIPYVEEEIQSDSFIAEVQAMPVNEVSSIALPQDRGVEHLQNIFPLLDYIVPLYYHDEHVGALVVTLIGGQLDHIIEHATRLYDGQLSIIENNPGTPSHGQLIYDKQQAIYFNQIRNRLMFPAHGSHWLDALGEEGEGSLKISPADSKLYYIEMQPYPDQLLSWIIRSRIKPEVIASPFKQIRLTIWLLAASSLLIALLVTLLTAEKLSRPIQSLASHLKNFADGNSQPTRPEESTQNIDEIHELTRAFNYLVDTLETTQRDRDCARLMAAGIGHEINNPLNNILSYSKLIQRSLKSDHLEVNATQQQLLKDINDIRSETLRASEIIKGLLNFARQLPPDYQHFPVQPWLEKTLGLVQQSAADKPVTLNLDNHYHGNMYADELQLQQALINLLLNAIAASPPMATVTLFVRRENTQLIIEVEDQGSGIDAAIHNKIFNPFFSSKAEGQGSGLGLSISLGIIERHQGILSLTNNPAGGAKARISLPLQPPDSV